jgi:hypothetical protein
VSSVPKPELSCGMPSMRIKRDWRVWKVLAGSISGVGAGMVLLLGLLVALLPMPASAVKRRALLVGANEGWTEQKLRYARKDAHKLLDVLVERGGFAEEDIVLLEDPTVDELREQLDEMKRKVSGSFDEETLFIFYYSGHADSEHLHLQGNPAFSLKELLGYLHELPATQKVGILDACQSGAILKGGQRAPLGFEVSKKANLGIHGLAVLTSSTAEEPSQESKELAASFFTLYLVSGLSGLADTNGDNKVSLGEVHAYAQVRTAAATLGTQPGAQHPVAKIEMTGYEDLYLTFMDEPGASLSFPSGGSPCFLTDRFETRLLAEIPPADIPRHVLVPAGAYVLKCEVDRERLRVARVDAKVGEKVEVTTHLTFYERERSEGLVKGGRPVESRIWLPLLSGGVLASGGAFWALAKHEQWRFTSGGGGSVSRGEVYQAVGFSLMGVGAVGLGIATGMHVLREGKAPITMGVGTNGTSIFMQGRWR